MRARSKEMSSALFDGRWNHGHAMGYARKGHLRGLRDAYIP